MKARGGHEKEKKDLLLWQSVGYGCHTQKNVTASVKTGEIENCPVSNSKCNYPARHFLERPNLNDCILPEFPEIRIGQNGSENGSEVAEH